MNRFVIGDVHGCAYTLKALLDRIGFNRDTELYLLGDYIDRGPRSAQVLSMLIEYKDADYRITPLMGNHEELMLMAYAANSMECQEHYDIWMMNGGHATLESIAATGGENVDGFRSKLLAFLADLPKMIVLDDYVLVHAGLDFSHQDPIRTTSDNDKLWIRNSSANINKLNGKKIVTGHTIQRKRYIKAVIQTHHICLDNGCFLGKRNEEYGHLTAFNLDTHELIFQPYID